MKTGEEKLETLLEVLDQICEIEESGIYILTGSNGSGKSMIRKQIALQLASNRNCSGKGLVASCSMQMRTETNPEFGALSSMIHDLAWLPTSLSTLHIIESLVNSNTTSEYYVIDEPEIGMGEELQLALVEFLTDLFKETSKKILIITHSRILISGLKEKKFFSLDGYKTKEEWLNRPLKKASFEELKENNLFKAIQDVLDNKKKK